MTTLRAGPGIVIALAAFAAEASSAQDTQASSRLAHSTAQDRLIPRTIRMIVGFSAGGGSDFAASIAGQKITEGIKAE